jgi:phospholipase/carboxylesterase
MNRGEFTYLYEPGDPTLVMLHGTGGNERDMFDLGHRLLRGSGYLSPLGKEPEGSVNRWFRRFEEGVFDEPNLILRAEELGEFVESLVPDARRIAVGFSNGANVAAAALLLRPSAFHGAALLAPMVPLQPTQLPDLTGKPILMVCGEHDPIVPMTNAQTLATMLTTAGADLTLYWHSGGHHLSAVEWNVVASWLARVKGG